MKNYAILKNILEAIDGRNYSQATIDMIEGLLAEDEWNEESGLAALYHIENLFAVMRADILDYELWSSVLFIADAIQIRDGACHD